MNVHQIQQNVRQVAALHERITVETTLRLGLDLGYGIEEAMHERETLRIAYCCGHDYAERQGWTAGTIAEHIDDIIAEAGRQRINGWTRTLRFYAEPFTSFILGCAAAARDRQSDLDAPGGLEAQLEASIAQAKAVRS